MNTEDAIAVFNNMMISEGSLLMVRNSSPYVRNGSVGLNKYHIVLGVAAITAVVIAGIALTIFLTPAIAPTFSVMAAGVAVTASLGTVSLGAGLTSVTCIFCIKSEKKRKIQSRVDQTSEERMTRAKKILNCAVKCSAVLKLYQDAKKAVACSEAEEISIVFVDEINGGSEIEGRSLFTKKNIQILARVSDNFALSIFIFELTNFCQRNEFSELDTFCKDSPEPDGLVEAYYVRKTEQIEYMGAKRHHEIMEQVFCDLGIERTRKLDRFSFSASSSFDENWEWIQKTPHAKAVRDQYLQRILPKRKKV